MKQIRETLTVLMLGLLCGRLWAGAPLPPEIEDPECLGINKEPAHATLMPYGNLKEALTTKRHESSLCRSLNGMWKFHWVAHPAERPVDFYKPDFDVSAWKEIPVPSNWQLLGYGTPYYRNIGYTFQRDWPRVMSEPPKEFTAYNERNPVGSYRREFEMPSAWQGRRVFLTFDGVDAAFFLWINGQKVGFSVNSRNAAEFDITRYLKPGKNLVAAEVYRYCAGSYLEDQDMWRLSGIFRNVTLWSAPQVHVRDFFVQTDLDNQYQDATLQVTAKVRNYSNQPAGARKLVVTLFNKQGKPVEGAKTEVAVPTLNPGEEKAVAVSMPVAKPAKWTAETPNLYTTVLTLVDGKNEEILSTRTGFRKVEIKGRLFTVNGVPVKLKGANRHENWPDTGHYVTEEKMIRDLEVLMQGNCNHVRTCHYPDDPRWYELCDEWGIYLTAEANVECHGYYGVLDREPRYEKAIVDRNVANVQNFKNHASVIMWSLGNENGGGTNFVSALHAIKAIDASRPAHYEPFGIGDKNPADIDSQMYTHPRDVERIGKDDKLTKPFYMCEYAHAMFNSMGSISDYNDIFDKYPSLIGGAIWEWQDQGIWNARDPKRQYMAYGGGFGEVPNDHYFIHKGVVFSDRSPKPHYPEMKRAYQWIGIEADDLAVGKVKIRNKYAFIYLNKFKAQWTLAEDGKVIDHGFWGKLALGPGEEQVVIATLKPITPKPGAEYYLRVSFTLANKQQWAKAGYEVAAAQFKLPVQNAAVASTARVKPVTLEESGNQITVRGDGFSVVFDKAEGTLVQLARNQANLLVPQGGPKLHLWRAPHRNDDMWAYKDWQSCGLDNLKWQTVRFSASQADPSTVRVEVVLRAEGKNRFSVAHSAVYTVTGDGVVTVDNAVVPQGPRIPLARMGVRMLLNPGLDRFAFLGRGPMENYSDRKRGSDFGLYTSSIREQMTPYAKPMECGNHEDIRWAAVSGKGLPTLMAQADANSLQVSAIPYTDEVMTPIEYTVDLPKSTSTVLTLASQTLGAGSAGCGPRPLDQYIVWSEPTAFSYLLRLLPAGEKDLAAAGRLAAPQNRVKPVLGSRDNSGRVSLTCATEGARIEYAVDGTNWQPYTQPFELSAGTLSFRASSNGLLPYQGAVVFDAVPLRGKWKVVESSSFESG
ncbi:MAG TPA: glycoside hydrolase family 2 TIM barrel-domain containing protein, partial [Clostridia bacterium]|nr:glycoside hydrolase family 2 TIM barrel-domain containing protein [Clostridia bacterium]